MSNSPTIRERALKLGRHGALFLLIVVLVGLAISSIVHDSTEDKRRACRKNLHLIQTVKVKWPEGPGNRSDNPTMEDLFGPDGQGWRPHCPSGGTYSPGALDQRPTCSITNHVFGDAPFHPATNHPANPAP